jgi:hypothetical protein
MLTSTVAADSSAWAFGWEAVVAIGTLALAASTWWLARKTSALALTTSQEVEQSARQLKVAQEHAATALVASQASTEQTRLAQLTLNAQIRPVLVDLPPRTHDPATERVEMILYPGRESQGRPGMLEVAVHKDGAMVSLPLRNAGNGLAMIRGISLEVGEATPPPSVAIQPANVPPGEQARMNFLAAPDDPAFQPMKKALAPGGNFDVVVAYSDLAGQQMTLSRFSIYDSDNGWVVRQVHLQEPDAAQPYAGSAPTV